MAESVQSLFAFVLMPFDPKFDDLYKFGIKEVAAKAGVIAERVDEQKFTESMLDRIYRQIDAADVIIAEMTGQNPNVFYEVGYAHAKDKLVILSTADANDIPFDLKHRRHIVHGNSIVTLGSCLTEELNWVRDELKRKRTSPIRLTLSAKAELTRHGSWDEIGLKLTLDLNNDTNGSSPEIEAIYLSSGDRWTFTQDGHECPWSPDDIEVNTRRHFLKPPVRRLLKNGWAQIVASGTKTEFPGPDGKPESYPVKGRVPITVATSTGEIKETLSLDIVAEEFPF
jgi:hypothetical protein